MKNKILIICSLALSFRANTQVPYPLEFYNFTPDWVHYSIYDEEDLMKYGFRISKSFQVHKNSIYFPQNILDTVTAVGGYIDILDVETGMLIHRITNIGDTINEHNFLERYQIKNDTLTLLFNREYSAEDPWLFWRYGRMNRKRYDLRTGVILDSIITDPLDSLNKEIGPYLPILSYASDILFDINGEIYYYIQNRLEKEFITVSRSKLDERGHVEEFKQYKFLIDEEYDEYSDHVVVSEKGEVFVSYFYYDFELQKIRTKAVFLDQEFEIFREYDFNEDYGKMIVVEAYEDRIVVANRDSLENGKPITTRYLMDHDLNVIDSIDYEIKLKIDTHRVVSYSRDLDQLILSESINVSPDSCRLRFEIEGNKYEWYINNQGSLLRTHLFYNKDHDMLIANLEVIYKTPTDADFTLPVVLGIKMENLIPLNSANKERKEVVISPNPSAEYIDIISDELVSRIEIMDMSGSVVKVFQDTSQRVYIGDLPSNTYVVNIYYDRGMTQRKIVVQ